MEFTHIDNAGNAVMVDVSAKPPTSREAIATGYIEMSTSCFAAVQQGTAKKGDVLGVAQVAGIMAVKQTASLIPLCHSLQITSSHVDFKLNEKQSRVQVTCKVCCVGKTGVEMEALTGASVALLTVYDMCKALDKSMVIGGVHLVYKAGGKSGIYTCPQGGE